MGAPRRCPSRSRKTTGGPWIYAAKSCISAVAARRTSREQLKRFRKQTGALAVTGYTRNVDSHEAAVFGVLLLSELAASFDSANPRPRPAIKRAAARSATLSKHLGFVAEPPLSG